MVLNYILVGCPWGLDTACLADFVHLGKPQKENSRSTATFLVFSSTLMATGTINLCYSKKMIIRICNSTKNTFFFCCMALLNAKNILETFFKSTLYPICFFDGESYEDRYCMLALQELLSLSIAPCATCLKANYVDTKEQ